MSDRVAQRVEIHRLSHDSVEACGERAAAVLGPRMRRAGDGRRTSAVPVAAAHAANQLVTILDRHADI
jgi:hypothetical protein